MDHLTSLVRSAQAGDDDALHRFIAETQGDVWRLCRYLSDAASADDLTQETYERAIIAMHRFRGDGPARSWLLAIARHICADATRRSIRRRRLFDTMRHQYDEQVAAEPAEGMGVDELVSRLDPDRREAFVLTQVVGLHYDEAAEVLGCPIGTIRSRVARARADLVEAIDAAAGGTTASGVG